MHCCYREKNDAYERVLASDVTMKSGEKKSRRDNGETEWDDIIYSWIAKTIPLH